MTFQPAPADTVLPGRWLVHDPAGAFSRQQTLAHLLDLSAWLARLGATPRRVRVELDLQATETAYWPGRREWLVVGPGAGGPPTSHSRLPGQ